ncbi:hypothetical protein GGX14DRAFT_554493 [Mycena pura]|uniref:Small ribosomal subunit protein eS4 central region domain-containing protein n=1 Tax=Mycena pura TaxID=153505 RepID=A0AAD6YSK7_9AGAR|nr:hypothetical protein GGX14DRAFT_554493 [Mycena pura]
MCDVARVNSRHATRDACHDATRRKRSRDLLRDLCVSVCVPPPLRPRTVKRPEDPKKPPSAASARCPPLLSLPAAPLPAPASHSAHRQPPAACMRVAQQGQRTAPAPVPRHRLSVLPAPVSPVSSKPRRPPTAHRTRTHAEHREPADCQTRPRVLRKTPRLQTAARRHPLLAARCPPPLAAAARRSLPGSCPCCYLFDARAFRKSCRPPPRKQRARPTVPATRVRITLPATRACRPHASTSSNTRRAAALHAPPCPLFAACYCAFVISCRPPPPLCGHQWPEHVNALSSSWMLDKLSGTYARPPVRRSCGSCSLCNRLLKYALAGMEVVSSVKQRLIKIDNKLRTDSTYPAGFMGARVIRLLYDVKGRFTIHRIAAEEATYRDKLLKVCKFAIGAGGIPDIVTHDGRIPTCRSCERDRQPGQVDFVKFDTGDMCTVAGCARWNQCTSTPCAYSTTPSCGGLMLCLYDLFLQNLHAIMHILRPRDDAATGNPGLHCAKATKPLRVCVRVSPSSAWRHGSSSGGHDHERSGSLCRGDTSGTPLRELYEQQNRAEAALPCWPGQRGATADACARQLAGAERAPQCATIVVPVNWVVERRHGRGDCGWGGAHGALTGLHVCPRRRRFYTWLFQHQRGHAGGLEVCLRGGIASSRKTWLSGKSIAIVSIACCPI